jgi:diguanylate cyclase (GGDEF)-like protein/PAS domain S-box-containing protein
MCRRRFRTDHRLPVTALLVVLGLAVFAASIAYTIAWRERLDDVRIRATRAREDVDTLQAIYLQANSEFLQGFGTARQGSFAWPIERVGAAVACFDRLERDYGLDARGVSTITALRKETARWVWQLAEISLNARVERGTASLHSDQLLAANRLLADIVVQLAFLRERQTSILRATSDDATQHTEIQGIVLAVGALLACSLLGFAFAAHYRAGLAQQRIRLIAIENERRFREYFDQHPLPMLIFDVETLDIIAVNSAAASQYGSPPAELCAKNMASLYAEDDRSSFRRDLLSAREAAARSGCAGVCRHLTASGSPVFVDLSYHFLTYAKRSACFITAIDVTARKRAELALRLRSRALDAIGNAVLIIEADGDGDRVEYANPAFEHITGYARDQIVGDNGVSFQSSEPSDLFAQVRSALEKGSEATVLVHSRRANGTTFWNQLHVASVPGERGSVSHHIAVINDVSELVESRDRLVKQARRDALTGLPNRSTLHELIDQAVAAQKSFAVLFLDIDHFKDVNDSIGHGVGDRLLAEVGKRLSNSVGSDGTVTRYGGDEFVAMVPHPSDDDRLTGVLERVKHAIAAPVRVDNIELPVQLSIGVASFPEDGQDAETLLKHADLAMYQVKASGRNGIRHFDLAMATAAEQRIALSRRLRDAVEKEAFDVVYQLQVDAQSEGICGVEALIRWNDPVVGPVSPATFVPLVEEIGMIEQMGKWVLNRACTEAASWMHVTPGARISVNVSPRQLAKGDFCAIVQDALRTSGLASHQLELEITEGALVVPGSLPALRALSKLGVSIAIDDFGTGYSSLSYLRTFHADRLKIDMSFVRGIGRNRTDEAIVRAVLALAQNLGFEVVAEGVETREQLSFLKSHGCRIIQGYLFSRPLPADQTRARFPTPEILSHGA